MNMIQEQLLKDLDIIEKYHINYKNELIELSQKDFKQALIKLRYDSGYPILECKKFLINQNNKKEI